MKNSNRKDSYLKYLRNITINKISRDKSKDSRNDSLNARTGSSLGADYHTSKSLNVHDNKENGLVDHSIQSFASLMAVAPLGFNKHNSS
jgi:hypothetical protein